MSVRFDGPFQVTNQALVDVQHEIRHGSPPVSVWISLLVSGLQD
jgi:hypothetical protein